LRRPSWRAYAPPERRWCLSILVKLGRVLSESTAQLNAGFTGGAFEKLQNGGDDMAPARIPMKEGEMARAWNHDTMAEATGKRTA